MHLLALGSHQLGHNREADVWLRRAAPRLGKSDRVDVVTNRGSVLLALGRHHDALTCAEEALRLDSGKARALCVRAGAFRAERMPIPALRAGRQAVALAPSL